MAPSTSTATPPGTVSHLASLQRAGLFFLPLALLVSAAFFLFYQQRIESQALIAQNKEDSNIRLGQQRIASDLSSVFADLRFLADSPPLQAFLTSHDAATRDAAARQFLVFSAHQGVYDQIRFLDTEGKEQVRVDWHAGAPEIVPTDRLQDKSRRYYVSQTLSLARGSVYLSPFDLNIENGEIEQPIKPVIRFAMPVFDQQGQENGLIVLNYLGQRLLNKIAAIGAQDTSKLWLLNDAGYWLAGPTRDDEWAFMYEDRLERNFAQRFPEAWARLHSGDSAGQFEIAGDLYNFARIAPAALAQSGGETAATPDDANTWILLSRLPAATQAATLWSFTRNLILVSLGVLLILAVTSLVIARYWLGRQAAIRDLDRALHDLQSAQEEIVRSEKLSSLGSLVAGVAHELGTPIGNAVTVASTMSGKAKELERLSASGQIRRSAIADHVRKTIDAAALLLRSLEYASELIGHFKQLAVDQTSMQRRSFAPGSLIRDVAAMMQPQLKKTPYQLTLVADSQITLDSYPGSLSQVLLNLLNNALIHGLADREYGTITVTLRDDGKRAIIAVADDGHGMDPETQNKIFDPFFTTRRHEGGTGLGLHIVHNIVVGILGGEISAHSRKDAGTTFILSLPLQAPLHSSSGTQDAYKSAA